MHRLTKIAAAVLLLTACSPRIYRPPALGAEYRFDEGLKPAKHPSTLFDKKTTKELQEKGILDKSTSTAASAPAATGRRDSTSRQSPRTDSTAQTGRTIADSLTTPAPASSPASSDSSHSGTD